MAAKPNTDINLLRHIYEISEWINSISVIAGKKIKKKKIFVSDKLKQTSIECQGLQNFGA